VLRKEEEEEAHEKEIEKEIEKEASPGGSASAISVFDEPAPRLVDTYGDVHTVSAEGTPIHLVNHSESSKPIFSASEEPWTKEVWDAVLRKEEEEEAYEEEIEKEIENCEKEASSSSSSRSPPPLPEAEEEIEKEIEKKRRKRH